MFWLLVLLLIFTTVSREKAKKAERRRKIKDDFGSGEDVSSSLRVFDKTPKLYEYKKNAAGDDFYVDDITANDLGLKDVFSRMNRCITSVGEECLYCLFMIIPSGNGDLYDDIKKYMDNSERSVELSYILDDLGRSDDVDGFELACSLQNAEGRKVIYDIIPFVLLVLSVVLIGFYPSVGITASIVMICICIWSYFAGKRRMDEHLKGLALTLRLIRCARSLNMAGLDEFGEYRELFSLLNFNRLIPYKDRTTSDPLSIIFDYVRMITHIDIIVYDLKISSIREHTKSLAKLYEAVGLLDSKIALASYLAAKKHCRAEVFDECIIDAKGLYHPLIAYPVCNDIRADRGIVLTGSNASGKSTFLKAVGINALFARSMGFAFADSFKTGRFSIYTSMALSDNLLGAQSYYVVEAASLKRICDAAISRNVLCIIDEVLRGTNTIERIAASSRILKYLSRPGTLCFAATHDIELANILKDDMDNYHFTEEIHDDNVTFPFVIQKGSSDKTNAIRLLAMLGFDRQIVESAKQTVEQYKTTGKWVNA